MTEKQNISIANIDVEKLSGSGFTNHIFSILEQPNQKPEAQYENRSVDSHWKINQNGEMRFFKEYAWFVKIWTFNKKYMGFR